MGPERGGEKKRRLKEVLEIGVCAVELGVKKGQPAFFVSAALEGARGECPVQGLG